ncbi:MAG: hypothetical protein SV186_00925 [Candidatus Nanohaloarchaea archaeon]|nr:hypothetical protein [Candidatus Nanohaloarchaea archaeon]
MSDYTRAELRESEQAGVAFPVGDDVPELFDYPELEEDASKAVVGMDQEVNENLYPVGGDGNPIHYDPEYAAAYGEEAPFFDVPEGETVIQGSAFIYEAIRNAEEPVDSVSAEFHTPVFTGQDVRLERERYDEGEEVTVYDAETDEFACHVDMEYGDGNLEDYKLEEVNAARAMKPPRAVGADDQLNNLLLAVDADLGPGKGVDIITHDLLEDDIDSDVPYNRRDQFSYLDGTEVEIKLVEPDERIERAVRERYEERSDTEVVEPEREDPAVRAMQLWTEAWTDMVDFWTETTAASVKIGAEMTPPYTADADGDANAG